MVPTTKSDTNKFNPTLQSTLLPDLTALYNATSTCSLTMNPIQSNGCNINHQQYTKVTGTTAFSSSSPDPTSQAPASPTPLWHSTNNGFHTTLPTFTLLPENPLFSLDPSNKKPELNWLTFVACWCQQHAATTTHIQHIIIHSKMEIFHFLLSTSTRDNVCKQGIHDWQCCKQNSYRPSNADAWPYQWLQCL